MASRRTAPVHLDLLRIRFPVGAVTSIGHRISGTLLFVAFPFFVYLFGLSLRDAAGFRQALALLEQGWVRLLLIAVVWSLFHHLCAGIRFLLIDIGLGVSLSPARASAWLVNAAALVATLLFAGWLA